MQSTRHAARRALSALAFLIPMSFALPAAAGNGLCGAGEKTWFEAKVAKTSQLVAVCTATPVKGDLKWMQFRMGTPDELTLAWPKERKGSLKAFTYRRYTRFRVTLLKLEFRIRDVDYALLEHDISEDKPQYGLSLRISKAGRETEVANRKLTPVTEPLSMMRLERYFEAKPYDE